MLTVRLRYFGRLRELFDVKGEEYQIEEGTTLTNLLLKHVPERHKEASEAWRETVFKTVRGEIVLNRDGTPLLKDHLVLIEGRTLGLGYRLKDGDEVAVLPPVGGG